MDIGDFIGVRGTVSERRSVKSLFIFIDGGFGKSLETASC
jgi:hypothetical protein